MELRFVEASHILDIIRYFKLIPISVQQRVIALHPETNEIQPAKILTAANSNFKKMPGRFCEAMQYRAQFDRSDLGVPLILD